MYLVVGLGNPGPKYARNRHNVGFMVVARLAGSTELKDKFKGRYAKVKIGGEEVVLLTPLTYMNLSGESVQAAMRFFKIDLEHVIVVHDEVDLPFGTLRVKQGGGVAGHNGLRSIVQHCGGQDFLRLRVGIGRPTHGAVESHVLGDFDSGESAALPDVLQQAARAVGVAVQDGVAQAMNTFNARPRS